MLHPEVYPMKEDPWDPNQFLRTKSINGEKGRIHWGNIEKPYCTLALSTSYIIEKIITGQIGTQNLEKSIKGRQSISRRVIFDEGFAQIHC